MTATLTSNMTVNSANGIYGALATTRRSGNVDETFWWLLKPEARLARAPCWRLKAASR
jgi:hypothetical protein